LNCTEARQLKEIEPAVCASALASGAAAANGIHRIADVRRSDFSNAGIHDDISSRFSWSASVGGFHR
jgi:hypothetical protein